MDKWPGITQDLFVLGMVQGNPLHSNQKPPLVKPSHKFEVKMPKVQEAAMSLEITKLPSEGTVEPSVGNKGS